MKTVDLIKKIQPVKHFKGFPKTHMLAVAALGSSLLLFSSITPSKETPVPVRQASTLELPLSALTSPNVNTEIISPVIDWKTEKVKSGDSLSLIFQRAGLADTVLHELMQSNKEAKQLTRIHPGQKIQFNIVDGQLEDLRYQKDRLNAMLFSRNESGFNYTLESLKPDTHTAYREATITNSLFLAGTQAGMDEKLIMELASIFGWDVDFALDIRAGDSFKVLFEEQFLKGEKLRNGPILAAEFTNQGQTFKAVRFTDSKGDSQYYTPEGKSMRKAFLRTPVDFARISSHFNLQRKHPILNKIRAHKGTDYAAPTGTPIKAAGDGRVTFAGTKGGYGRTVIIQHGQSYKTLYAHMHRYGRGIRSGTRVKQGQIIGYVGSSGLATGPHLHYEFYLNGAVRNPVRVPLPKAKSVAKSELEAFKLQTQPIVAQLKQFSGEVQLAANEAQSESRVTN